MQLEPERLSLSDFEIHPKKQMLRFRQIKNLSAEDSGLYSIEKPLQHEVSPKNRNVLSRTLDFSALGWTKAVTELPKCDAYFQI